MNPIKNNLLSKVFTSSYDSEIFKMMGSSFLLLIILPAVFSYSNSAFIVIELLGGLIFFPIFMASLRSYENQSLFTIPKIDILLNKAWRVFLVNLIVGLITFLGLIIFIIPGIIFRKRYLYVGVICEKENMGPLEAMKKSKEISMKNGWKVLFYEFFLLVTIMLVSTTSSNMASFGGLIVYLTTSWLAYVVINSLLFYGYKEAASINKNLIDEESIVTI